MLRAMMFNELSEDELRVVLAGIEDFAIIPPPSLSPGTKPDCSIVDVILSDIP